MDASSDETGQNKTILPIRLAMQLTAKVFPDVALISTSELDGLLNEMRNNSEGPENEGSSVILLDIREPPEFEESRLLGADFIDFTEPYSKQFKDAIEAIKKKMTHRRNVEENLNIFAYCAVGIRASMFTHGFTKYLKRLQIQEGSSVDPENARADGDDTLPYSKLNLQVVQGSIFKWAMEDRPMVDKQGNSSSVVHQCSVLWGKIFLIKRYRHSGPCPLII